MTRRDTRPYIRTYEVVLSVGTTTSARYSSAAQRFSRKHSSTDVGIRRIVKIDFGDDGLDLRPDAPVEARNAAEKVNLDEELLAFVLKLLRGQRRSSGPIAQVGGRISAVAVLLGKVGGNVVADEGETLRLGRHDVVVALEAAPLGEVVANIKGGW
ncbi:hypothetical protein CFIMG_008268RA00001 [Ceratocystis fimbriata CBS 114723]|uniref:Uncharacterized protein n=1 Tax=Ceratocystis fimbriata CBS 114723 TaxID=1035309 RepID=A0A2C5X3V0_9PEZI|nr:hypothetical protein CFIMG_008268RA00001 [Ceratocystis fimbriata CBS 114723]